MLQCQARRVSLLFADAIAVIILIAIIIVVRVVYVLHAREQRILDLIRCTLSAACC